MNHQIKNILLSCCLTVCLGSCISNKKVIAENLENSLSTGFYEHHFVGLLLVDANTKDTIYEKNSARYFTPASNTKIFTLYTALKTLPNKIPALRYIERNDTLYFEGTGDPSFLHPFFQDSTVYHFLKKQHYLAFYSDNFNDTKYGPGWAWEDYDSRFSPERSGFPIHGNIVSIASTFPNQIVPRYFRDSLFFTTNTAYRDKHRNRFYVDEYRKDTLEVPFITGTETIMNLLEHTLDKSVTLVSSMPKNEKTTLYGIDSDALYVQLMQESDNFIAEQLLLLSAGVISDTLHSKKAIAYTLDTLLPKLPQQPRWVDGSGLSRYNLFTPRSLVYVLDLLHQEIPQERLFKIFPAGGVSGTLTNWFSGNPEPYIYAKSGSLGNNYCLSGYLLTKSGKTVLFSFMNNHFRKPSAQIKQEMERLFENIRDTY